MLQLSLMLWIIGMHAGINANADAQAVEAYNRGINMLFTENAGQLSDDVVFYSMHPSVVYVLKDGTIHINGVRLSFGSSPKFITGNMPLRTKISYFGQNRAISNVPTYKRVVLKEVYPKIDAILTADGRGIVEFQFIVKPGGDPSLINVETDGKMKVKEGGVYVVKDGKEVVRISGLKAFQGAEEVKVEAEVEGKILRFNVEGYDQKHTLVIDPVATAIVSSNGWDEAHSVAVDGSGNVFIAGWTSGDHNNFAPSRTIFGTANSIDTSAFVSKLSGDLSTHIATAIISSTNNDYARSVALDGSGNVFVAGYTSYSNNFAPSRTVFGTSGDVDAFVTKLTNDLSSHLATAILTSSGTDYARALAVDGSGNVFVAGYTNSSGDFAPSRNLFGSSDGIDVFVTKLTNDLSTHTATAILASNGLDDAFSLTVDASGNVFVAGYTFSYTSFAPSRTVFGTPGIGAAFVSKFSNDLSSHLATAILTSSMYAYAYAVAVDGSGDVFVAGYTMGSSDFAPSRTVFGTSGGIYDAFVTKLTGDLSSHLATAILTSSSDDYAYAVAVDGSGNAVVVGHTFSYGDFAPGRNVYGTPGDQDVFVTKMSNDLSTHISTAMVVSPGGEFGRSVVVDASDNVYIAGNTGNSGNFGPSRNVFGTTGYNDAFVSKLSNVLVSVSERPKETAAPAVKISKGKVTFTLPTSAYVGYDVYLADGRLIRRVSLGYLPAGRYEYDLNLPKGVYLFKVRVGDEVRRVKGVM